MCIAHFVSPCRLTPICSDSRMEFPFNRSPRMDAPLWASSLRLVICDPCAVPLGAQRQVRAQGSCDSLRKGDVRMAVSVEIFPPSEFLRHGSSFLWNWRLILLHVISDTLIALAYLSIPITLVRIVRKRKDLPFNWMFLCFGTFIVACSFTHLLEVLTLWYPVYWISGAVKCLTAVASVSTAVLLMRLIPTALAIPSQGDLIRSNQSLRESEENYRLVVEHARDYGIFRLDPEGRVVSWNLGAERINGYSSDEILGCHFSCFFTKEDVQDGKPEADLQRASTAAQCEQEGWRVRKNGSLFWANVVIAALRDPSGRLVGFSKVIRDSTLRKQAEDALLRLNQELEARVITRTSELEGANRHLGESLAQLEVRSQEIGALGEMAGALEACQSSEEVFQVVRRTAQNLFPNIPGALGIIFSPARVVEVVTSWGETLHRRSLFVSSDCWALRNGHWHCLDDTSPSGLRCLHLNDKMAPGSLCVPLHARGEALGVLSFGFQSAPGKDVHQAPLPLHSQERLASAMAEQVGLTLANLRLRETLSMQAIRDPLTGLFNRRYMEESLDREVHRSLRSNLPLGVILMDLDHFKVFNDTYGHAGGDSLLRAVGELLRTGIRTEDIACRYGGEEFAVILSETALEVIVQRAELLRQLIKNSIAEHIGSSGDSVTVSLGVAISPDHGKNGEDLLRAADEALYRAKALGRDRVIVAGHERTAFRSIPLLTSVAKHKY
jgi:diguanylate cyclase (GGDEF)-like protein/PAS domain S-box-containing protein